MSDVRDILQSKTIAELEELRARGQAKGFGKKSASSSPITLVSRTEPLVLSFAQQRLWFLAQLEPDSVTYHIPFALRLRGRLDVPALRGALDRLFARHEALRSVFTARDGSPWMELLPAEAGLPVQEHDLRLTADAETQARALAREEVRTPFDLACGPLIRARLIRMGEQEHVVLLTQHHIVSDGWSMAVLVRELSALYRAALAGTAEPLAPLRVQYPDYAAWQRRWLAGERLRRQAEHWRRSLADAPVLLTLPTDRPRPPQQCFTSARLPLRLGAALTRDLKQLSQQHGTTLFMSLLAAWAAVLSRLSGQDDLVIGTPTANRGRS